MKKLVIILISILIVAIIGVGVFYIISMNKTIAELNDKINSQPTATKKPIATAKPVENHDTEIAELEILYNQKEYLVQSYYDKSDEIKSYYSYNEDFAAVYGAIATRSEGNWEAVVTFYNEMLSEADQWGSTTLSATLCVAYDSYVDQQTQVLIESEGIIKLLKSTYSVSNYNKAKSLLESIKEIDI